MDVVRFIQGQCYLFKDIVIISLQNLDINLFICKCIFKFIKSLERKGVKFIGPERSKELFCLGWSGYGPKPLSPFRVSRLQSMYWLGFSIYLAVFFGHCKSYLFKVLNYICVYFTLVNDFKWFFKNILLIYSESSCHKTRIIAFYDTSDIFSFVLYIILHSYKYLFKYVTFLELKCK